MRSFRWFVLQNEISFHYNGSWRIPYLDIIFYFYTFVSFFFSTSSSSSFRSFAVGRFLLINWKLYVDVVETWATNKSFVHIDVDSRSSRQANFLSFWWGGFSSYRFVFCIHAYCSWSNKLWGISSNFIISEKNHKMKSSNRKTVNQCIDTKTHAWRKKLMMKNNTKHEQKMCTYDRRLVNKIAIWFTAHRTAYPHTNP